MIKKCFILFFLCSFILSENINSIFYNANSPRVNSLGGCIFSSNNISDVINNPLDLENEIMDKTYFSYYSFLNNSVNIFQVSYNVSNKKKYALNIGFLGRLIRNNYNTQYAWLENNDLQYEDIDYSLINNYDDTEVSIVLSIDRKFKNYNISAKIKPIIHLINDNKGLGISSDIYIAKNIDKINLMIALKDFYYKKWDNNSIEKDSFKVLFSTKYQFENFFIVGNFSEDNNIGIEYELSNDFILRFGYNKLNKYTYGFGLHKGYLSIDYSYQYLYNFSTVVNQFSLSFKFKS